MLVGGDSLLASPQSTKARNRPRRAINRRNLDRRENQEPTISQIESTTDIANTGIIEYRGEHYGGDDYQCYLCARNVITTRLAPGNLGDCVDSRSLPALSRRPYNRLDLAITRPCLTSTAAGMSWCPTIQKAESSAGMTPAARARAAGYGQSAGVDPQASSTSAPVASPRTQQSIPLKHATQAHHAGGGDP